MLVGPCIWGTICKCENGMPKVARNAFNIEEVWNPVCYHGNKTVKLKILWSTFSRILLQRIKHFRYKFTNISFSHHIWSKFGWMSVWHHDLANLHISKHLNISGTHSCQPPEYKNLETSRNLCVVRMSFSTMSRNTYPIGLLNVPGMSRFEQHLPTVLLLFP